MDRSENSGYFRTKSFLIKNRWRYLSGFFVLAFLAVFQLLVPRVTGDLIDHLNSGEGITVSNSMRYVFILLAIAFMLMILHFISRLLLMKTANQFAHIERTNMFGKIIDLSMDFFTKRSTGEIMALATNDVEAIRHMLGRGIMMFFNMIFVMVSSVIIISSTISFDMALLLLIPMPLIMFVMSRFGIIINRRFRHVQQTFQEMTEKAQENITGIRVVKAFVQEDHESENFSRLSNNNYDANISLVKVQGLFSPLITLIMDLGQLFVLFFGGKLALEGSISLGDFIALNSYVVIIMSPIRMIGNLITLLQRGRASMQRITDVLKLDPDIFDGKFDYVHDDKREDPPAVEFRDLSFSYGNGSFQVLDGISFSIRKGKTLGVIGRVGSGKSTIASLILRLYETKHRGEILIEGRDISEFSLEELRDKISYVPQENVLFSDTFSNNIDFMPEKHDTALIEEAAKKAHIYDMITQTSKGFSTMLGERGINISGGEKQRLSIARALLKGSDILILDDCLSAVDTDTEKEIIESLRQERKKRASIIISHRISTVMDADEIIVLDNGRIVERGDHKSLISQKGIYERTYRRQTMEEEIMKKQVAD